MRWLAASLAIAGCLVRLYATFRPLSRVIPWPELAGVLLGLSGALTAAATLRAPLPDAGRLIALRWRVVAVLPAAAIAIGYAMGRARDALDFAVAVLIAGCAAVLPWALGVTHDTGRNSAATGARLLLAGSAALAAVSILRATSPGSDLLVGLLAPLVALLAPGLALSVALLPAEGMLAWLFWAPVLALTSQVTGLMWLHLLGLSATPAAFIVNALLITLAGLLRFVRSPIAVSSAKTTARAAVAVLVFSALPGLRLWPKLEPTPPTPPYLKSEPDLQGYPLSTVLDPPVRTDVRRRVGGKSGPLRIEDLTMVREPTRIRSISATLRNTTGSAQRGWVFYVVGNPGQPEPWKGAAFALPRAAVELNAGQSLEVTMPGTPELAERTYGVSVWVHLPAEGTPGHRHSDGFGWATPLHIGRWAGLEMDTAPAPGVDEVFVRFRATNLQPHPAELVIAYALSGEEGSTARLLSRGTTRPGGERLVSLRVSRSAAERITGYVTSGGPAPGLLAVHRLDER